MADWQQVKQYVYDNFVVENDVGEGLKLLFQGPNERSQVVLLSHLTDNEAGEPWVLIESPIGRAAEIDLTQALAKAGDSVCGGLGLWGADQELLMMRHAVPLENLDANELVRPLQLVAGNADRLERELTGGDRF